MPIIDTHVHIGPSEKFSRDWSLEDYVPFAAEYGVDHSITIPNVSSIIQPYRANEVLLAEYLEAASECVSLFFLIDSRDPSIQTQIVNNRKYIKGLKYHPSVSQELVNSPFMEDLLYIAQQYELPILVHCGRNQLSHIRHVIDVAKRWKQVRFIAAHMGGNATDLVEEALDLLVAEKLDNIWLDTSAMKLPWLITKGCGYLGADRIFFASDEPYADLRISIACVDYAEITDRGKELIFYENARDFFDISVKPF